MNTNLIPDNEFACLGLLTCCQRVVMLNAMITLPAIRLADTGAID